MKNAIIVEVRDGVVIDVQMFKSKRKAKAYFGRFVDMPVNGYVRCPARKGYANSVRKVMDYAHSHTLGITAYLLESAIR